LDEGEAGGNSGGLRRRDSGVVLRLPPQSTLGEGSLRRQTGIQLLAKNSGMASTWPTTTKRSLVVTPHAMMSKNVENIS